MSPVDPRNLKASAPVLIDHDVACTKCGYNLVGLTTGGVCPECGWKIRFRAGDLPRFGDNLVNAPMAWLGVLATGSLLLFLGSVGVFASLAAAAWLATQDIVAGSLVAVMFGALWYIGVWLVTRPRPINPAMTVNPKREWAAMRWSARATQLFWCVSALCLAGYVRTTDTAFTWLAILSFVIAALGLIPLCALVSNIAYWGSDTTLSGHFRACAWTVGFAAVLIALHVLNVFTHSVFMGGIIASMIAGFLIFFSVLPFFYIIFSCFQLQGMSRWALFNHASAEAKDERLRRKAAAAAEARVPDAVPLVENVDMSAFNLADSTVDAGANQELLRRQGHVVQPKAHDETPLPVEQAPIRPGRPPRTRT